MCISISLYYQTLASGTLKKNQKLNKQVSHLSLFFFFYINRTKFNYFFLKNIPVVQILGPCAKQLDPSEKHNHESVGR